MANYRSFRGAVNVVLNGLVRDGVISGFETSFDSKFALAPRVRITVLVGSTMDADIAKAAVAGALDRFRDQLLVTVKRGETAGRWGPEAESQG